MSLLTEFARHGVRVRVDDDGALRAHGTTLTDDLRARIRTEKEKIVAELAVGRYATEAEAAELKRLLTVILARWPEEIPESLAIACADPQAALGSFRALANDMKAAA